MSFEFSPWSGLFRPVAEQFPADRWSDAVLIVPDRSLTAARLGVAPAETPSAWFDRYVKAYVTAGDYLTGALAARGLPFAMAENVRRTLDGTTDGMSRALLACSPRSVPCARCLPTGRLRAVQHREAWPQRRQG